MENVTEEENDIVIMGGGLAGLSAGYVLTKAGFSVRVFERDTTVGGLSKTVVRNGFRFDLGGHRFYTKDEKIDLFVRELMGNELVSVRRSSKIYMRNKYFDYPLKPLNAMFGLGISTTFKIIADYALERIKRKFWNKEYVSLEDWVVGNFGRTLFNIYFKEYSEKVWGIDCARISASWVAQRIKGLSLTTALKNAFFKFSGKDLSTLTDSFYYPSLGIGRLSERLKDEIEKTNEVFTDSSIVSVNHADYQVKSITVRNQGRVSNVAAKKYISTIPISKLVTMLNPASPAHILEIAEKLKFRDLVVVAIMVDRERVTDQTWIYIPERKIPFGRIHEPTNWSRAMAPPGKTLLVIEFFCSEGDAVWNMADEKLTELTVDHLVKLGFISRQEVIDSKIVRAPNAYPLFEVGYQKQVDELLGYLERFDNLYSAGRSGMFCYYNMDAAIRSGMETAEKVIWKARRPATADVDEVVMAIA